MIGMRFSKVGKYTIRFDEARFGHQISWRELYRINEAPAVDDSAVNFSRDTLSDVLTYMENCYKEGKYTPLDLTMTKDNLAAYNLELCRIESNEYGNTFGVDFYFLYDTDINEVYFFTQLVDTSEHFKGLLQGKVARQNAIWKNPHAQKSYIFSGFTKAVLFQHYFDKYDLILSDTIQSTIGRRVWESLIKEALRLKYQVFAIRYNKRMPDYTKILCAITSPKDIDAYYKGTDQAMNANIVFGIYK